MSVLILSIRKQLGRVHVRRGGTTLCGQGVTFAIAGVIVMLTALFSVVCSAPAEAAPSHCANFTDVFNANEDINDQLGSIHEILSWWHPGGRPASAASSAVIARDLNQIQSALSSAGNPEPLTGDYVALRNTTRDLTSVLPSLFFESWSLDGDAYTGWGTGHSSVSQSNTPPQVWGLYDDAANAQQRLFADVQTARTGCP